MDHVCPHLSPVRSAFRVCFSIALVSWHAVSIFGSRFATFVALHPTTLFAPTLIHVKQLVDSVLSAIADFVQGSAARNHRRTHVFEPNST